MNNTWKLWLHGLAAAALGAIGTGISASVVDPSTFNFTGSGWEKLGEVSVINALLAVALYLKSSPIP